MRYGLGPNVPTTKLRYAAKVKYFTLNAGLRYVPESKVELYLTYIYFTYQYPDSIIQVINPVLRIDHQRAALELHYPERDTIKS